MKKILIVFDGEHFSKSAFDFACRMNEATSILLTGIFLPSVDYTNFMLYYIGGMAGPLFVQDLDANNIEKNVEKFKTLCEHNGIDYRVHTEVSGSIVEGIKKETRYADLLILSSELFYHNMGSAAQEQYLKETMHKSECPLVILPEQYTFPASLILAYDGSQSSVFAMKQFSYLFPELSGLSALVVYASDSQDDLPDMPYIEEFAARHFKDLEFFKLDTDPDKYFSKWIGNYGNALLITGSYGRSFFSEIFRRNFVADVIKDHKLPVFIAH